MEEQPMSIHKALLHNDRGYHRTKDYLARLYELLQAKQSDDPTRDLYMGRLTAIRGAVESIRTWHDQVKKDLEEK
jgi:hypothetical protein